LKDAKGLEVEVIVEERGKIIPIADGQFKSVIYIQSKKGAVRANHYHRTDSHVMYLLNGKARYVEALMDEAAGIVLDRIVGPGERIVTQALVPHAMEFLEDTEMIVCANNVRDYDAYMSDIQKRVLI